jgi:hypothetical protein
MANLRCTFSAILLVAIISPSSVRGQLPQSAPVPEKFEFFEGHAYLGGEHVKWEHNRLVFVKRVADMKGQGSFIETEERLSPAPEAWQQFWTRIDSLGVWRWKSDYSDPKRDGPDGESWALTLRFGAREVKSKGYNGVPGAYSDFRDALHKLMESARRHERD